MTAEPSMRVSLFKSLERYGMGGPVNRFESERMADSILADFNVTYRADSPQYGTTKPAAELSVRDRAAEVGAAVEREHQPTTGMRVAMGETCRCGYWNGEEVGGVNRPVGMSGLMWHRAQEMADALAAAGLLAGEAVDVDEIKRRAVEKITIMNKVAEQMGM